MATGRFGSDDHCDHDPAYSATGCSGGRTRACSAPSTSAAALMPDPQYAAIGVAPVAPCSANRRASAAGASTRPSGPAISVAGRLRALGMWPASRVDGLRLAAVARRGAGVEQHTGAGQLRGGVRVEHRHRPGADNHVALVRPRGLGGGRSAVRDPPRPSAVQDRHPARGKPGPPQQPPGAGRDRAVPVVVGHHHGVGAHPGAPQHGLQPSRVRQRMPPAGPGRIRQLRVEVDEHGARDVCRVVIRPTGRTAQPPPHVEDDDLGLGTGPSVRSAASRSADISGDVGAGTRPSCLHSCAFRAATPG